ncbi:DUF4280 domain-containing protein [Hymenobacter sp. RP-2-7]|uniref:DUF4280 domain-containing protein n=1 Tax=Hymenobacter polaris TaxID=2682546 RepID=A0A7Y0FM71_9BACT|nr:DUF6531 domain-containing protein [Hymenobacter polaris]NML65114.1 DUF4280 domain-containing protein [Hymenobacter polaris]
MSQQKYVPANVFLRCDKGATPCQLLITRPGPDLYDEKWAVEGDGLPGVNVTTFGACAITHGPCVPATMRWQNTLMGALQVNAGGLFQNPLLDDSILPCAVGGKIDIFFTRAAVTQAMQAAENERQVAAAKQVSEDAKAKSLLLFGAAILVAAVVVVATGGAALPLIAGAAAAGAVVGGGVGAVAGGIEGYAHGGAMGAAKGAAGGLVLGAAMGAVGGAAAVAGGPVAVGLLEASGAMFGVATAADAFTFYKQPTQENGLVLLGDLVILFGGRLVEGQARKAGELAEARATRELEARPGADKAKCTGRNEPVDVASGAMYFDSIDFVLPGPIPVVWERSYFSTSNYQGPLGYGWYHRYDVALWVDQEAGTIAMRLADGRVAMFEAPSEANGYYSYYREHHLELRPALAGEAGYDVHAALEGVTYHFQAIAHAPSPQLLRLVSITDTYGHSVRFDYSAAGHLCAVHDSVGRVVRVETDAAGRHTAVHLPTADGTDATFVAAHFAYDEQGQLISVTNAEDHARHFRYEGHRMVQKTFAEGTSYYYEYDTLGRCTRTWGDENYYNGRFVYELGLTTLYCDEPETVETYYHQQGLVTAHRNALGQMHHWRYSPYAELETEQDALGRTTSFAYDARGNCTQLALPDGATEQVTFDEHDRRLNYTNAAGSTWHWTYNPAGELISEQNPLGATIHYQYDAEGRVSTITDALNHVTHLRYDAQHNLAHLVTPDGHIRSRAYDALGRLVELTDALGYRQYRHYDRLGRLLSVREPDGRTTKLHYDAEGNVVRARSDQQEVAFAYTAINRLAVRQQAGQEIRFAYDRQARLVQLTNEHGRQYKFALDAAGRVVEEIGFDGLTRRYERNAIGQVARMLRPAGRSTHYTYDAAGRIAAVAHNDEAPTTYRYGATGALHEACTPTSRLCFEYDALGQLVRADQDGHTLAYSYDVRGQRTHLRSSLGATIDWQHDAMGNLTQMQAGTQWQAQLQHDARGLELHRQLSGGVQQHWQYDGLGRPTQQLVHTRTGQRQRSYHWQGADQLTHLNDSLSGATRYTYDALGTLTGAHYADGSQELRVADAVGNLFRTPTLTDRHYAPGGQLREASGTRYRYDAEGNLVSKTEPNGQQWSYTWDGAGQLVRVTRPDGYAVSFGYDALGRRLLKRYRGRITRWVWDGHVPLHEWNELALGPEAGHAEQVLTWLFEAGSFAPAAKLTQQGAYSVVSDQLGTPLALYDGQGQATWEMALDCYGAVRQGRGHAQDCPWRYQGQYEDVETGLYYNRFRYYDPHAGQYISQDPIGVLGSLSLYSYVANTASWLDVLGLAPGSNLVTYPISSATTGPLAGARATGIDRAWALEKQLVTETNAGTRTWSQPEMDLIKSTPNSRLTSVMSRAGYTGHHINSVEGNGTLGPAWQGDPRNIVFLENHNHPGGFNNHVRGVEGHGGHTQNATSGNLIDRQAMLDAHRQALSAVSTCP